jgi:hypothetical protein
MTRKEYVERNIGMTFDFVRHLVDCPEQIESIPNGALLDFIDKDIPFKLKKQTKGKKVARYKVEHVFGFIQG